MEILKQWGPYAPLLLLVWVNLAFLITGIKLFKKGLHGLAIGDFMILIVFSAHGLSYFVIYPKNEFDASFRSITTFEVYSILPYLSLVLLLFLKEQINQFSYIYPGNALFFRNPLVLSNSGAINFKTYKDQVKPKFILPSLPLLVIAIMAMLVVLTLFICGIGMRTCGWLDSATNYSSCIGFIDTEVSFSASLNYSPDGNLLAYSDLKGNIQVIDITNHKTLHSFRVSTHSVNNVAFSPDGKLIAGSQYDGVVKIWQISNETLKNTIQVPVDPQYAVNPKLAFSPDSTLLATATENIGIKIWKVEDGSLQQEIPSNGSVIAFSPDGTLLATESKEKNIIFWSIKDRALVRTIKTSFNYHSSVLAFSPDGSLLVTGNEDLNIWRASDGVLLQNFKGFEGEVGGLAFSPNGKFFATNTSAAYTSEDNSSYLTLWISNSGQQIKRWKVSSNLSKDLAFSPDGRTIATSGDGAIRFWRIDS